MMRYFLTLSLLAHLLLLGWGMAYRPISLNINSPMLVASLATNDAANKPRSNRTDLQRKTRELAETQDATSYRETAGASATNSYQQTAANPVNTRVNHLRTRLHAAISENFVYPPLAQKFGWQGRVLVGMELSSTDGVDHVRVVRSSQYLVLDKAAVNILKRISKLPELRRDLPQIRQYLELPIYYQLRES